MKQASFDLDWRLLAPFLLVLAVNKRDTPVA
jgi:hypothetical protein